MTAQPLARHTSSSRARRPSDPAARAILADAAARKAQQGAEPLGAVADALDPTADSAAAAERSTPGGGSGAERAGDAGGSGEVSEGSAGPGVLRRSRARVIFVAERALPALEGLATVIKVRAHTTMLCVQPVYVCPKNEAGRMLM